MAIGYDIGTYNLIVSKRNESKEVKSKKEVNCFLEIPLENPFMFKMLKDSDVKIIEREKVAYVVGEAAVQMAYALPQINLRRPMKDGCLNPQERDAFKVLSIMLHSMIGEVAQDREVLYYSIPANATNQQTDVDFHNSVLQSIFKAYRVNGKTVQAYPINEALAVVFSELKDKRYTGIGISFGAGSINLCYSIFSQPVFQMSLVNSGDWIDRMAAQACGESPTVINKEKTKIDLTKAPTTMVERAIQGQYQILIQKTVSAIRKAIEDAGTKANVDQPLDVVIAGGTASPPGFPEMIQEAIKDAGWAIPVGNVRRPPDFLYSVAKGALIAAENSQI